jgi:hypothetical protein
VDYISYAQTGNSPAKRELDKRFCRKVVVGGGN